MFNNNKTKILNIFIIYNKMLNFKIIKINSKIVKINSKIIIKLIYWILVIINKYKINKYKMQIYQIYEKPNILFIY